MNQVSRIVLTVLTLSTLCCTVGARRDSLVVGHKQIDSHLTWPPSDSSAASRARSDSGLYFISLKHGWALIEGRLYGTSDGGNSWVQLNRTDLKDCRSIVFASQKTGWARCDEWVSKRRSNSILLTRDGGKSWRRCLELPTPIYAMSFLDEKTGYVSSRWHALEKTTDGGSTWTSLNSIEGLNYIYFIDEKRGWAFGGAIWHTNDGGETWKQDVAYELVNDLWSADFVDSANGWIVGSDQVWHTTDGETWQRVANLAHSNQEFLAVDFINQQEGWLSLSDGLILHTVNGGVNWQVVTHLPQSATAISFITCQEGWALDAKGDLIRSIDGGRTWTSVPLAQK
jgi:photosystem II stability/assembly factor-like uncharacterized protein